MWKFPDGVASVSDGFTEGKDDEEVEEGEERVIAGGEALTNAPEGTKDGFVDENTASERGKWSPSILIFFCSKR